MKTIWKFPIEIIDVTTLAMPVGAQILCVQAQHNIIQLWALCDASAQKERRKFRVFCTGHQVPTDLGHYIGTVQINGGTFVFHVFEATGVVS